MTSTDSGILDEAYERFHTTGPEFNGGLSNHGPMAVEAMTRHGHAGDVHAWIDWYQDRLEDQPRGLTPVTREDWREALGDPKRLGDWRTFMLHESRERPWRELLVEWWPRLLPGIIAGATHGVIRVGHSVRALLEEEAALAAPDHGDVAVVSGPRVAEFAHAVAYWAARWTPLETNSANADSADAGAVPSPGLSAPSSALAELPRVAEQRVSISHRISQLCATPGWSATVSSLRAPGTPQQAAELLGDVVNAAVLDYLTHGQANPIMLVHASTAPTAVLRTLPVLPQSLWIPSLNAAWLATAAVTAAYRNTTADPEQVAAAAAETGDPHESFDRAVRHRDEHAVKFADSALDAYERTGDPNTLAAATRATMLIKKS
jgi:hypothetical protein